MHLTGVNPLLVPATNGGYVNAMAVESASRLLFISGQTPQTRGGDVPVGVEKPCRLIWTHLSAVLDDADMTLANLVKVTTFLGDRAHAAANTRPPQRGPRQSSTGPYRDHHRNLRPGLAP